MNRSILTVAIAGALLSGCASSPPPEMDPEIEAERLRKHQANEALLRRQEDIRGILLNLDKTLDKYVEAVVQSGMHRADQRAHGIEKFLRDTVTKHFDELVFAADDVSAPGNRAIAVAALGFSSRQEALDPMLNGARDEDPIIANNAVFGLGVLQDPRTPPQLIANCVEDASRSTNSRIGAAWALFRIQEAIYEPEAVYPVWLRLLTQPAGDIDAWILVQALRGLSRSRNPSHASTVEPMLDHPTALVRTAAATCLGYLGNREAHDKLLGRLGPNETNPNVRLAVRKALQALAGGIDRGYDVTEWRRVFETTRGS